MKKTGGGKRFPATSGVVAAIAISGLLAAGHQALAENPAQEGHPRYAPGVLIVKFRQDAADHLKAALTGGEPLHEVSISPSLDMLAAKWGLTGMRMLFRGFQIRDADGRVIAVERMQEHVDRVRQKFPARAARAPDVYTGPDLTTVFKLHVARGHDMEAVATHYQADPAVEHAHPDYVGEALWEPNDYFYNSWGSWGQPYEDLWGIKRVGSGEAWDLSRGSGTIIAVLDTGIWYRQVYGDPSYLPGHPDIVPNLWVNYYEYYGHDDYDDDGNGYVDDIWGRDFAYDDNDPLDDSGHGTYVAGIAGALGGNAIGVIGLAPEARIMNVKVIDAQGQFEQSDAAEGIFYAADNGADVLNCSFGQFGKPWAVLWAVQHAHCEGCVVIAAAGNSNDRTWATYPASFKWSLTTSATGCDDLKASYSNWGHIIDVAAPGGDDRDILSLRAYTLGDPDLVVDGLYYRQHGTSAAAPHVAAAAALIFSHAPQLNPEEVRQCIRKSAVDDAAYPGFDVFYGHGRLDAEAALYRATAGGACPSLILEPEEFQLFRRGEHDCVDLYGIADGDCFQYWETHWAVDERPWQWVAVSSGVEPRYWYYGGEMGTIYIADLPEDKYYYVARLTVYGESGEPYRDYVSFRVWPPK